MACCLLILQVSTQVLVLYTQLGGSVEQLCHEALWQGKPVFNLIVLGNAHLFAIGVKGWGE